MFGVADHVPDDVLAPERSWLGPFLRAPTPAWEPIRSEMTANGAGWRAPRLGAGAGLLAIVSGTMELDGRRWIHVSFSRRDRMPSYDDVVLVKRLFIGRDRKAIQVHVPESEHVNIHRYCLHLWHCVDGDGLPDFRARGGRMMEPWETMIDEGCPDWVFAFDLDGHGTADMLRRAEVAKVNTYVCRPTVDSSFMHKVRREAR